MRVFDLPGFDRHWALGMFNDEDFSLAFLIDFGSRFCENSAKHRLENMKTKLIHKAGFTLVEIMIVVAIIGLLAAIAIPNFVRARTTSQQNACINNLRLIDGAKQQWALEQHQQDAATISASGAELQPYLGHGAEGELPSCPADSTQQWSTSYAPNVGNVSVKPQCSIVPATHICP